MGFTKAPGAGRLVGIEYQGTGHYPAKSFMRDAVKREALRKSGVPLLEVPAKFRPDESSAQVRRVLAEQGHGSERLQPTYSGREA